MASDQIEVAALGRPFALGMLYDAHRDKLDTAFRLWDKKTLHDSSEKSSQYSSFNHSTVSDSIDSKSTLLDINASLKASFLCGLVEVGGSASYLNDNKKFKNQSRVTFSYKATTNFERLAMTHLEAKNMKIREAIEKSSATHVVTGILYGANAFFVFDSEKLDASCVQNIQGSMETVIKKIPSLEMEGNIGIKLSNEEKALTQKFSCKYYGDFILESNPATFEDAVKTYTQLPKQLGEHGERSVPVKVWLTPLKNLDHTAAELKREICVGLVRKAENVLEMMKEVDMRCNDSLEEKMVKSLQPIFKKLSHFQKHCRDYTTTLKHSMEEAFPAIRAGEKDVSSVENLFDQKESSPFSHDNLKKWLDNEEREINIIRSCVDLMEGTKIVQKQGDVDREVLAPGVEDVLCFVFSSMETTDAYLEQMDRYLHSHEQRDASVSPPTRDQWYISAEVVSKMRQKAKEFHQLAKGLKNSRRFRFLIAAMPNKNYKGATIYHYRDGSLVTEDFSRPRVPPVESIKDRRDLIWYATDLTLDPNTANYYLTLSDGNKKALCGSWQSYPDHPERFDARPQVLCLEGLTERHYWEVEWSEGASNEVGVGVTYSGIGRSGTGPETGLGTNTISWYFGVKHGFSAWHNGEVWSNPLPSAGCKRVAVFLDCPAGSLSFYRVSANTLSHLYTFNTQFTEPLYPGFYTYNTNNYAALCQLQ